MLDFAFLFQGYNEHLGPEQRGSAVRFAEDVVDFVNGEAPKPRGNGSRAPGVWLSAAMERWSTRKDLKS